MGKLTLIFQFHAQVGVVLAREVSHELDHPLADLAALPGELDHGPHEHIGRGTGGERPLAARRILRLLAV